MDRETQINLLVAQELDRVARLILNEERQKLQAQYASLNPEELERKWWDEWMPDRFERFIDKDKKIATRVLNVAQVKLKREGKPYLQPGEPPSIQSPH